MGDRALRDTAFRMMLTIVNEWHRQVGIDEVVKTKLTRAIADTVATGVIEKTLGEALRAAREEERTRCIQTVWAVKDRRGVVCREEVDLCRDIHNAIEAGSERAGDL